ncbi:MAG: AbrB family transcriptional regulator [Nocardioidaceae bacterium]
MSPGEMTLLLASGAAGAAVGRLLRLPMWPMTGALAGAALMHVLVGGHFVAPGWWSVLAQVLVGTAVGATVAPNLLREFRSVLVPGAVAVLAIVGIGVGCGLAIGALHLLDPTVAVFGTVPGGVGEMVAAATALDVDSALVAAMHTVRLLAVLWLLPVLVRWARHWPAGGDDDA